MLSKYKDTIKNREIIIDNVRIPTYFPRTMVNLDERYQSYLMNPEKKFRIDGVGERVKAYGWHCEDGSIVGHYVTTENYKLFYNMNEQFIRMQPIREVAGVAAE